MFLWFSLSTRNRRSTCLFTCLSRSRMKPAVSTKPSTHYGIDLEPTGNGRIRMRSPSSNATRMHSSVSWIEAEICSLCLESFAGVWNEIYAHDQNNVQRWQSFCCGRKTNKSFVCLTGRVVLKKAVFFCEGEYAEYGFDQQKLIWYVFHLWDMVFSWSFER